MQRLTIPEFHAMLKAQGVSSREHAALKCPICGTVQSFATLMAAGASCERAEKAIGFSCEGRLTNAGPWPSTNDRSARAFARRSVRGCDWTLGGLFSVHELEVMDDLGKAHPRFVVASPDEAKLCEQLLAERSEVNAAE
jgi:hypothetical protein